MSNPLFDILFASYTGNTATFIVDSGHTEGVSYDAFLKSTAQCANAITEQGLQPGDRLAAQVDKSIASLVLYAACVQAGIVYLPLNTTYTTPEVDYFITDSGAKLLVCKPESQAALLSTVKQHQAILMTQSADGKLGSLPDACQHSSTEFLTVDRKPDDIAAFLYTSGTTGRSKGAMLTQANLLSNCEALAEVWQFTKNDVLLHALPIFHTHGLFVATNVSLISGAKIMLEPRFNVDRIIQLLPGVTTMMGVPTFYTRLLGDERFNRKLTRHMRLFISGSAPLLTETHLQFEKRTGHRILERYGMTETNMNTSNPYDGERRAGTVGFALPGVELKITDPVTAQQLPQGDIGQIEVRGPNVFKGYWNMPEKTAQELRADGFFITGDLGLIDADGYLSIVGRDKDLIISGGYNIYPKEIESILDEQLGVVESAVVGVPHPDFGETVVGVLVVEGDLVDLNTIQAALTEQLAKFKHPRQLVIVEALPRNTMGKVQKNLLRDQYKTLFTPQVSSQ